MPQDSIQMSEHECTFKGNTIMSSIDRFQPLQGFMLVDRDVQFGGDSPMPTIKSRALLASGVVIASGGGSWNPVSGLSGPMYAAVGQRVVFYAADSTKTEIGEKEYVLIENSALIGILNDPE